VRRFRLAFLLACACLGAVAGGASGRPQDGVPPGAIAVVAGEPVSRSLFDAELGRRRHSYALRKRAFPRAGTPAYRALRDDVVDLLVWRVELRQAAAALGIAADPRAVERRINQVKQQRGATGREFARQLAKLGLTVALMRADISARLTYEAVREYLAARVSVSEEEIADHYRRNLEALSTPPSRDVADLVVKTRAEAVRLRRELARGASFVTLVRRHSLDRAARKRGGVTTLYQGRGDLRLVEAAFALRLGAVSSPVAAGRWHLLKALSEIRPAHTPTLDEVTDAIREIVRQAKTNAALDAWTRDVRASYAGRVVYAPAYAPAGR
jgi:parvulin-like peptidyl-prolyl isomerase